MTNDLASRLEEAFNRTMHALTLLGHQLPRAADEMSPQQLKLLWLLAHGPAAQTMSALAKQLGVTPGTLTEAAKRLVKGGYVARERAAEDDRIVRLSLTAAGEGT